MTEQLADNRTIDDLCATQIMGWARSSPGYAVPIHGHLSQVIAADKWQPSTRIEDAWQLMEKFTEETHEIDIIRTNQGWYCSIGHFEELKHIGLADTAPMCICLAALKACGISVSD